MIQDNKELIANLPRYLNNVNLKAADAELPLSIDQLAEMEKIMRDPIYFIENYVRIISIDDGWIPFRLYPYQKRLINLVHNERKVIAKFPRQSGKTTTNAAYLLWYILVNEVKTVGILAHKASGAREVLERTKQMYEGLPLWLQQGVVTWNKGSIELGNGCRVIAAATTSSAIRGLSISFLLLDEFAFIPSNNATEFFDSVYPTISSGKKSKISIFSTPKGMNHFYKMWKEATEGKVVGDKIVKSEFAPIEIEWNDIPGRDEVFKQKTIATIGQDSWDQEYACVVGNTLVEVKCVVTGEIFKMKIEELDSIYKERRGVVYRIIRNDGLSYIGITLNFKKRLGQHKRNRRFSIGVKSYEILYEGAYSQCQRLEPYFINKFDSFKNGLNITPHGRGLNETTKFNTFGLTHSEETRKRMSLAAKKRDRTTYKNSFTYLSESEREEYIKNLSKVRKGKIFNFKISTEETNEIISNYLKWKLDFQRNPDFKLLSQYCKPTQRNACLNGEIQISDLKTSSGSKVCLYVVYSNLIYDNYKCAIKIDRFKQILRRNENV